MDGIAIKGRRIIIPTLSQNKAINHLHINYVGIENTKLLACESVYCSNVNN